MKSTFSFLAALLLLSACVTTAAPVSDIDSAKRLAALQKLNSFRVTGGLGVWTSEESISTRIEWVQLAQDFDITVQLPAGLRTVRVTQTGGQAMVQNGGAEPVTGQSAAFLLQQALGLNIAMPVEQMSLWIKGLPGEQAEAVVFDTLGRLQSMEYVDDQNTRWQAKVLKYTTFRNTAVPALILATGGPYTVRLVLKQWSEAPIDVLSKNQQTEITDSGNAKGRLTVPGR